MQAQLLTKMKAPSTLRECQPTRGCLLEGALAALQGTETDIVVVLSAPAVAGTVLGSYCRLSGESLASLIIIYRETAGISLRAEASDRSPCSCQV